MPSTRVVGLVLGLTLCFVAPAAARALTFPITLADYWPNVQAMDAGWRLEAEGCPSCFGRFIRTGPATFAWTEGPEQCTQDHYLFLRVDQTDLGRDDPRVTGGIYWTHTFSRCAGSPSRVYFAPWRYFGPPTWEPGFGTLATPIRSHAVYAAENGDWQSTYKVREGSRWFMTDLEPDGIHTVWYDTGADEINAIFQMLEVWLGDVPFCDGSGSAPGWRRVRQLIIQDGVVASDVDFRWCWRQP